MSHHFDYPTDETLDISDCYCFAGPTEDDGPRTVFGMNTSPTSGNPWNQAGYYELRMDLNGDYVEDITWRFTFPIDSTGTQHVQIAQLTGADATDRNAAGTIITPPHAPVGQVLDLPHGIKAFAGKRLDPFFNYLPFPIGIRQALFNGTKPDPALEATLPARDDFLNNSVRSVILELPAGITGTGQIHCWATTAYFDTGHSTWVQVQRAAEPLINVIYDYSQIKAEQANFNYNSTKPTDDLVGRPANPETDPATGIWGLVRDATAAVIEAQGTFNQGVHGKPTALAYAAWMADTVLPNVLTYTPGNYAEWNPWHGIQSGKGLLEESSDNFIKMVLNYDVSTQLSQPGRILDYFPYLSEPPAS
jgi:hypothetical protein